MTSLNKFQLDAPSVTLLSPAAVSNVPTDGFEVYRVRCQIHPSVIMTMLNAHNRLSELYSFAIGTLLGTVSLDPNNNNHNGVIVDVVDCFANPFHWDTSTATLTIQRDPHEWMLRLREKINPKLVVVGWCCTSSSMTYSTAISDWAQIEQKISRFHPSKLLPEPIHILIDPTFEVTNNILAGTKAYVCGSLKSLFHEIRLQLTINPTDVPGVADIIKKSLETSIQKTPNENSLMESRKTLVVALKNLKSLLDHALEYVTLVTEKKLVGDPQIGRKLTQAISMDTLLPKSQIKALLEESVQDNLLTAYLLNLAQLQFVIAETIAELPNQ